MSTQDYAGAIRTFVARSGLPCFLPGGAQGEAALPFITVDLPRPGRGECASGSVVCAAKTQQEAFGALDRIRRAVCTGPVLRYPGGAAMLRCGSVYAQRTEEAFEARMDMTVWAYEED